jgi:hypothetical protein
MKSICQFMMTKNHLENMRNDRMPVRYKESERFSENPWIVGCAEWMQEHLNEGWRLYYINIMFKPFSGNAEAVVAQMNRAICQGFYSRLCTEFSHHPTKPSQQMKLPMMWLFPDRHIWKKEKEKKSCIRDLQFNDNGVHFNGPMLVPLKSRFHECPVEHIHQNQRKYAVHGIDRIHVEHVNRTIEELADYMCKTIKWRRASTDNIIVLPEGRKTVIAKVWGPEERALKAYQSQHNVSDEIARQILGQKTKKFVSAV